MSEIRKTIEKMESIKTKAWKRCKYMPNAQFSERWHGIIDDIGNVIRDLRKLDNEHPDYYEL